MTSLVQDASAHAEPGVRALQALQPLARLAARLYAAEVFLLSGMTKLSDWDTTLALFNDEYHVPLIPSGLAARLGTGAELSLPLLLVLGLGGRIAAIALLLLSAVAVLSLGEVAEAALQQHVLTGSLLIGLALWGPRCGSLDAWRGRRPREHARADCLSGRFGSGGHNAADAQSHPLPLAAQRPRV
jgi:putative oxidoreductase